MAICSESFLSRLYFYKYRINLKPRELIHLPLYKGSAIRGIFGYALRRVVCVVKKSRCDDCILRLKCIYAAIMESSIPETHPYHRKYKNAPHPYIIIPPLTRRQYFKPDDSIFFEIVLVGKANEYLPYFVYTFTEMGRIGIGKDKGKFDVFSVEALNLNGTMAEIFNTNGILRTEGFRIDYNLLERTERSQKSEIKDEITLFFETPLRIKEHDKLSKDIPFNLLIKRLSERALLLEHLYCSAEIDSERNESIVALNKLLEDSENVETIKNKLRWVDWERYSSRQQTKMKFGGWIGEITYKGDFQKYMTLLKLGEFIHVGKAVTFGLGKYRIK
ncbi:MAG: CRISPR system precrRNA processing endoribonuclease RAMP protein Cas6 [Thermodesulfovibrionales bacterium]